jgi:hypothetical protein
LWRNLSSRGKGPIPKEAVTVEPDRANEVYKALSAALHEAKLDWVVGQVNDEIAFGKPVVRRPEKRERGTRDDFSATEEYTHEERVLSLLEGIEQAVVEIAGMEKAIFDALPHLGADITFAPELPGGREHRFGRAEVEYRADRRTRLSTLIAEIRAEIPSVT